MPPSPKGDGFAHVHHVLSTEASQTPPTHGKVHRCTAHPPSPANFNCRLLMLGGRGQLTWKNPVAENGSSLIVKLNIVGYSSGVRTPGWHPWLGDPRVGLTLTTVGGLKIASDFLKPVSRRIGFLLRPQA